MGYTSLKECVLDLERKGHLVRVTEEVDPYLEMAEVQRRVYEVKGPAVYFENVKGGRFPAVCNLFGTIERCRFIFRGSLERVKKIVRLKADASNFWRAPFSFATAPFTALNSLPVKVRRGPVPVLEERTTIDQLPQIQNWPDDGGPFITLGQVYTEDPDKGGVMNSNLGMYRVQLAGNQYQAGKEVGLHYQTHRGIGIHHARAIRRGEPLKVSVFVGGPPAHTFAAVMPLPEGLTELLFAGMLGARRFRSGFVTRCGTASSSRRMRTSASLERSIPNEHSRRAPLAIIWVTIASPTIFPSSRSKRSIIAKTPSGHSRWSDVHPKRIRPSVS